MRAGDLTDDALDNFEVIYKSVAFYETFVTPTRSRYYLLIFSCIFMIVTSAINVGCERGKTERWGKMNQCSSSEMRVLLL